MKLIVRVVLVMVSVAVLAAATVCVLASMKSPVYRVERSASIAAPAAAVFEQVNDHRKFAVWNPFMKVDPNVRSTYSGPGAGVGAVAEWDGNNEIGAGRSTIVESRPGELVRCQMDWLRPMEGTGFVEFHLQPEGGKTRVTWSMYGTNNFLGKVVSVFLDCDTMCGPQFEKGLAELAGVVEGKPAVTRTPAAP